LISVKFGEEWDVVPIDRARRVYVSHVAVKSIKMPAMTMALAVTDPALLGKLKRGDQIDIEVSNVAGAATIVNFRPRGT
jgi:Cu/Ag efflux protein CusF